MMFWREAFFSMFEQVQLMPGAQRTEAEQAIGISGVALLKPAIHPINPVGHPKKPLVAVTTSPKNASQFPRLHPHILRKFLENIRPSSPLPKIYPPNPSIVLPPKMVLRRKKYFLQSNEFPCNPHNCTPSSPS